MRVAGRAQDTGRDGKRQGLCGRFRIRRHRNQKSRVGGGERIEGVGVSRVVRKTRVVMESGKAYVAGFVFDVTEIRNREEAVKRSMREADIFRRVFDELPVS